MIHSLFYWTGVALWIGVPSLLALYYSPAAWHAGWALVRRTAWWQRRDYRTAWRKAWPQIAAGLLRRDTVAKAWEQHICWHRERLRPGVIEDAEREIARMGVLTTPGN